MLPRLLCLTCLGVAPALAGSAPAPSAGPPLPGVQAGGAAAGHVALRGASRGASPAMGERDPRQDPEDDVQAQVVALMKVVRDRRTGAAERVDAAELLLDLGPEGATALARHLERDLKKRRKENGRDQERLLDAFRKGAERVLDRRLDREALAAIEADREVVLGHARRSDLSKATIVAESDPALERLERALTVTPNQVWDAEEERYADYVELLDRLDEERLLGLVFGDALGVLEAAGQQSLVERLDRPEDGSRLEEDLQEALRRAAAAASPMSETDRRTLERNAERAQLVDPHELAGIARLNRIRLLLGLNALLLDPKLCDACRDHSKDMREQGFFSHDSPVPGKETPWKRAANFGTTASSENIAVGARTGPDAIRQWWYSPGHHRNMLSGASRTGLGRHGVHWTQLFGG